MKKAFVLKSLVVIALAIYSTQTYAQRYFENVTWLVLAAEDRLDHPQHAQLQLALFPIGKNETKEVATVRARLLRAREEYDNMLEIRKSNSDFKDSENTVAELKARLKEFEGMPEVYAELKKAIEQTESAMEEQKPMLESLHQEFTEDPKQLLEDVKGVALGGRLFSGFKDIGNNRLMVTTETRLYNAENEVIIAGIVEHPQEDTFQFGIIDASTGDIVVPIKYEYRGASAEYGSIYMVSKDEWGTHAGILDYDGKLKKAFEYKDWPRVDNAYDIAVFKAPNNKMGFDHFDGHRVLEPQFDNVEENGADTYQEYVGFIGRKKYLVDRNGKISELSIQ